MVTVNFDQIEHARLVYKELAQRVYLLWRKAVKWHLTNFQFKLGQVEDILKRYEANEYYASKDVIRDLTTELTGVVVHLMPEGTRVKDHQRIKRLLIWGKRGFKGAVKDVQYLELEFDCGVYQNGLWELRLGVERDLINTFKEKGFEQLKERNELIGEAEGVKCVLVIDSYHEQSRANILITSIHKLKGAYEGSEVSHRG